MPLSRLKFDKNGNITEMPSEPPESQMKERIKIKAYPTTEAGGFVGLDGTGRRNVGISITTFCAEC